VQYTLLVLAAAAAIPALPARSAAAGSAPQGDVNRSTAVVEVGTSTITAADILAVKDRLPSPPASGDPAADRRARIAPLVHARLLVLEAEARGYDDAALRRELLRFEREQLIAELEAAEIRSRIVLDPRAVDEGCRRAAATLHLRQIVTATEAAGESLRTRALAGESFAELARARSLDPATATAGGLLPPVTWGSRPPLYEEAAYRLAPGEIAGPLAIGSSFVLVRLDSITTRAGDPDSVRAVVTETLTAARFRQGQVAFLDTMKTRLAATVVEPHLDLFLDRMAVFARRVAAGDSTALQIPRAAPDPTAVDRFGFTPAERALPLLTYRGGAFTIGDYAEYMARETAERAAERADRERVRKDLDQYFRHHAYADYARAQGYGELTAGAVAKARERALIRRLVAAEAGREGASEAEAEAEARMEALIASRKAETKIVYDDSALARLPF
jgi:hypothetical protein